MNQAISATQELLQEYYAPIAPLLKKEGVTNIYVNKYDEILYEQFGENLSWNTTWTDEYALQNAIKMLGNSLSQPIDEDRPLLDAVMPDGSRLNAGLPPALRQAYMTIRVFPEQSIDHEKLVNWGSMTQAMYHFLKLSVLTKQNMVISGGTSAGKTTIVQMLVEEIPNVRRLVVIEDTTELKVRDYNCLQLEAPKRKNAAGVQVLTLGDLVVNALRQTPESLVVGEMREPDAAKAYRTLLNTGHSGVITTVHADSAEDTISRLRDLVQEAMPGTPNSIIEDGLRKSLNVIAFAEKTMNDGKRTTALAEIQDKEVVRLFEWDYINKKHVANMDAIANSKIWQIARQFELNLDWIDPLFQPYIVK